MSCDVHVATRPANAGARERADAAKSLVVSFVLNGKPLSVAAAPTEILADTLREGFGLTGTKVACGTGDCGTCTVILDGEAVRSCLLLTAMVEGKNVVTIEGMAGEADIHPIQQAFIDTGAVQCGYCTPGMILAAKALLDENPKPNADEIKEAISGNLCRCTGYTKIIEAIDKVAAGTP
jgi:aerobic-type carbon monoxide dehydrogenase small subunit (CoxS/CutS family)